VEQSSEERRSNGGRGQRNGRWPPMVTFGRRDRGASPRGVAMTGGHSEQGGVQDQVTVPGSQNGSGPLIVGLAQ
jgi:hypothetical protein